MKLRNLILPLFFVSTGVSADILNKDNPPAFQGFKSNYADMVELANSARLPHRIFYLKPSTGENAGWFDAIKRGDLEKVKTMVAAGQDIEAPDTGSLNQTALGWAAFIGDEEMVDYLLTLRPNMWATDKGDVYNVLKSAALGKNVKVLEKIYQIMKAEVDINDQSLESDGETLVMVAASNDRREIVAFLIAQGANVNLSTTTQNKQMFSYDQSALTYACQRNLPEMQKLLIDNGALNHRTGKPSCS